MATRSPSWLNDAVFYQIYPQSYCDSNGDGIGDIRGIISKLDYIQSLGVNAIWLNPCFVSPFQDAGYDIADYYMIAPRYGTNADMRSLLRQAHRRGIKICLDLVPGHTSIQHPWFKKSCQAKNNKYTDRYIWTPSVWQRGDGSTQMINGYAERNGNYATNFFYCQPALNYGYANPDPKYPWQQPVNAPGPAAARQELIKIIDFWLKQGVDGFRVDMAHSLVKNDPDRKETIKLWQESHARIRKEYPEVVFIAEWGNPAESLAAGFNLDFMMHFGVRGYPELLLDADCFFRRRGGRDINAFLKPYLEFAAGTEGSGLISIPSANHDFKRPASDGRKQADLKVIFTFLLTWPGVPFIYYGDEIGMRFLPKLVSKEGGYDRTGTRTPMQWDDRQNAGFSTADSNALYIPIDPRRTRPTVKTQDNDPHSLLNHVRRLIALRKCAKSLQAAGNLIPIYTGPNRPQFVYLRESGQERFLVALNPSSAAAEIKLDGIKTGDKACEIGHGIRAFSDGNGTVLKMSGISYGVFKL